MPPEFLIIPIMLGAGIVQGLTGFGSALFGMPLLAGVLGARVAAPLFALSILFGEIVGIVRFRKALTIGALWRLTLAAICAIPIGVYGVAALDEAVVLRVLGVVVFGYALYRLLTPKMPRLSHPNWAYPFGFAAGLLSGAYNTGGPGYVIYGTTQGWQPDTFRANLQGVFLVGSLVALASHALHGNLNGNVLYFWLYATPSLIVGLFVGYFLSRSFSPQFFAKLVQLMLLVIGLSLIF
jgi:uncharacterized protein